MVLFAQNLYLDCIGVFAEAERLDPANARWPYFRGLALLLVRPEEEGLVALERASQIAPPSLHVRLRLAEQYLKYDRIDAADAVFLELLSEYPTNPRVLLGHGQILSRRGKWQDAVAPLRSAARHPTSQHEVHLALATAYFRLGKTAEAERENAIANAGPKDADWPDPFRAETRDLKTGLQPRIDETRQLLRERKVREAFMLIEDVLRDHPNSDEAYLTRAQAFMSANAFAEAEKDLKRAIELNPMLVNGHFLLGSTRVKFKDYDAAESSFLRAIELKPSYGMAHYALGDCRLKMGKTEKAMDSFRDALRFRPDLAAVHVELGDLLLKKGENEDAISHLEAASRLDPADKRARTLLEQARSPKKP